MKPLVSLQPNSLLSVIILCIPVWIFSCGTARAEPENFVSFGIAGGFVLAPDANLEASPAAGDANFDPGYSFRTSFGVILAKHFQLDAEYLFTYNNIDSIINPPVVTLLSVSDRVTHNLMLNAIYRLEVPPMRNVFWAQRDFYFYFGGGAGISWQDYTVETLSSGTDSSLSWQIILGFEKMNPSRYLFSAFPSPFLQYRFIHINEGDFGAFKADASINLIELGFRFYGVLGD